jgi:hypothetical protein
MEVGGRLDDIRKQAQEAHRTGADASQFHVAARNAAQSFRDEVQAMAAQVRGHMDTFGDEMQQVSGRLVATVQATQWTGRAAEAKHDRIDEINQHVIQFNAELDDGTSQFQQELNAAIDGFFTAIADRAGQRVAAMQESWDAEANHARSMADALEDLDARAANGT